MAAKKWGSFLIGLVIPFLAILIVVPFSSHLNFTVWGFPFLYFWMFLWFLLTAVCLTIAWYAFDAHNYPPDERGDAG